MKKQPALSRKPPRRAPVRRMPDAPVQRRVSGPYFRVLPLTIMMAVLLLGVKLNDFYHDGMQLKQMFSVQDANAEGKDAADKKDMATKADPAKNEKDSKKMAKDEMAKKDTKDKKGNPKVDMASLDKDADPAMAGSPKEHHYSQIELDLLQSLSARRKEIEARAQELDMKEKLLDATEVRVNGKLDDIKSLKKEVETLLASYNEKEDGKLAGLVKIYETMKPKDAAKIFNELDMEILLEVANRMAERRVAPVLAAMDPTKAKDLTTELAEYRKLRSLPKSLGVN